MTDSVECVVIGAGVVGLAVARACARRGWETVVVKSEAMSAPAPARATAR